MKAIVATAFRLVSPSALVVAMVLVLLDGHSAPLSDVWRPLVVGVALTLILQVAATLVLRDRLLGTYVTAIIVSVVLGLWAVAGILLVLPAWWWAVAANRRRTGRTATRSFPIAWIGRAGAIVAGVFLLLSVARVAAAFNPLMEDHAPVAVELPGSGGPDIFVLILDGYPRADTLQKDLGIDNSEFLSALARDGFVVDEASRANYMKTWLSVASMLHLRFVDEIPMLEHPTQDPAGQHRLAGRAIQQAPFAEALRERGYKIVAGTSSFTETDLLTADRVLDAGQPTNFENHVMETTMVARIVEMVAPGLLGRLQVDQAVEGLAHLRSIAREPSAQPIFMLSHIEAPHTPFAVDATGDPVPMPDCYPISCSAFDHYFTILGLTRDQYADRLAGYLEYTNQHVLDAVAEVVSERPDAVVIVMSDHGSRYDANDPQEHFRNLFAARTPGAEDVFPPGSHLVNVFRHLSNAYFDTDFAVLPYQAWFSDGLLLDLVPVDVPASD